MNKVRLFLSRTPAAVQAQAKALVSGGIMAVVTVLIPLLDGGHLSLRAVTGAVTATAVSYLGVWWKGNGPSEVNMLLGMLAHSAVTPAAQHVAVVVPPVSTKGPESPAAPVAAVTAPAVAPVAPVAAPAPAGAQPAGLAPPALP
jgi:hypothetical protein